VARIPPKTDGPHPLPSRPARTRRDRGQQEPPRPESLSPHLLVRRQNILQAATRLIYQHPYDEVQMREVADAAGVALGTVYRYFASKEHLFAAVFLAWQSSMLESIADTDPHLGSGNPPNNAEKLKSLAHRAVEAFERHPYFYDLLIMMARTNDPYARELSRQAGQDSERIFAEPLLGLSSHDRRIIVAIVGAMLQTYLAGWLAGVSTINDVYETTDKVIGMLRLPE
jgi:TetR/AcrR family transcriptional regulator, cholesterol catabolism regulator